MYTSFFGLNEKPFSISPDPRYLFMSERHTEALAHLMYGVRESGGFIQLTGEVGTGKTTLVRSLLQQVPDTADVALILNPQLSKNEFLTTICEELGVELPDKANSIKALINALNAYLLDNHFIEAIDNYDRSCLPIFSRQVLSKIQSGDASWEQDVPPEVAREIKEKKLIGYRETSKAAK